MRRYHRIRPLMADKFPARIEGELDGQLSRWLWIVKWILLIPHYVVLAVMLVGVVLLTVVAWISIVFTAKYPRWIFDFNVGVLQWGWRVAFYSYSALGTDEYPPFKLGDADYPARLEVDYPERLSRGLAWIKWVLAIPHLVIVGLLTSGALYAVESDGEQIYEAGFSLLGFLVLVAGAFLLFANRYPAGLFDFVMGINRWSTRVWSYVFLLHDEYPPFRIDLGGKEPEAARR